MKSKEKGGDVIYCDAAADADFLILLPKIYNLKPCGFMPVATYRGLLIAADGRHVASYDTDRRLNQNKCRTRWRILINWSLSWGRTRLPVCVLCAMFTIVACLAGQPITGGFAKGPVSKKEVVEAADFAIKAQKKAMQDQSGQTTRLEMVRILEADELVVAGVNYRLKLKVEVNGTEKQAEVVVLWQAWRKPDPYQLTSWKWAEQ